jgi:hypothetical protein
VNELFTKADTDQDNTLNLAEVLASCANTDIVPCQVKQPHTPHTLSLCDSYALLALRRTSDRSDVCVIMCF